MQADTLKTTIDTISRSNAGVTPGTDSIQKVFTAKKDSIGAKKIVKSQAISYKEDKNLITSSVSNSVISQENIAFKDTIITNQNLNGIYRLFENNSDSNIVKLEDTLLKKIFTGTSTNFDKPNKLNYNRHIEKGWVLGLASVMIIILLLVRIYFPKYLTSIVNSLVNFQISEKLMREKNILIRRVFTLLNINFVLVISLFVYIIFSNYSIVVINNDLIGFLMIAIIFTLILFIRLSLLHLTGKIFNSLPLFKEYIHNIFLINKNLGLYLLPVVISTFYLPAPFDVWALYFAVALIGLSFIYKYLRSAQIILKYKIFYFYTILYLCTLEILPTIVGVKFVLSLR